MKTLFIFILVLVVCSCTTAQVTPAADKGPVVTTPPAPQLSITFTALDGNGNPLRDITKDQVTVLDSNTAAPVHEVQNASDLPLDLGIVLLSSKDKFGQEQAAAIDLVQKVVRPGKDRVFVITAGGEKPWAGARLNWQSDPQEIQRSIQALDKDSGLPDAFTYELLIDRGSEARLYTENYNTKGGGFSIFDVIWKMMASDPRPVRRAVMIFRLPTRQSPGAAQRSHEVIEAEHQRVIQISQAVGVPLYTVALDDKIPSTDSARQDISTSYATMNAGENSGLRAHDREVNRIIELMYNGGRQNIERLADETGGRAYFTSKKNYADAVASIAAEIQARFAVTFSPAALPGTAQVRPLKVQVSRANRVSAPHAFVMPKQ